MQEKSFVKQNILKFIGQKGISKYQFYKETGITRGVLDQNNGLSEENTARFIATYPEVSLDWLLTGKGEILRRDPDPQNKEAIGIPAQLKGLPLIPHEAFAGYGTAIFEDLKVDQYYYVQEFRTADFLIKVKGSSMYPKYSSGDLIACKVVKERLFFQWNKIYAIYTRSQGVMVKRVRKSKDNNCITMVSDNPKYEPFDVPLSDIEAIALVIGVIRVE